MTERKKIHIHHVYKNGQYVPCAFLPLLPTKMKECYSKMPVHMQIGDTRL